MEDGETTETKRNVAKPVAVASSNCQDIVTTQYQKMVELNVNVIQNRFVIRREKQSK